MPETPVAADLDLSKFFASVAEPAERERVETIPDSLKQPPYRVTVYDNDVNTYEEVIAVLMIGTGCTEEEAAIEAWEVDHYGACVVHRASESECTQAAEIIATIGIRVEVECDRDG